MTTRDGLGPEPGRHGGAEELEADIFRTRSELARTAEALSDKLNVKRRVRRAPAALVNGNAAVKAAVPIAAFVGVALHCPGDQDSRHGCAPGWFP